MNHFFALPSELEERIKYFQNIWKNQVLLSKVSNISLETSDTFTEYQFDLCFESLKEIAKLQEEANRKAIEENQ